jgi:hypothetical protein
MEFFNYLEIKDIINPNFSSIVGCAKDANANPTA